MCLSGAHFRIEQEVYRPSEVTRVKEIKAVLSSAAVVFVLFFLKTQE